MIYEISRFAHHWTAQQSIEDHTIFFGEFEKALRALAKIKNCGL